MRTLILILGAAVALSGCSTLRKHEAPVCDGKHRRPANLYGSVLDPASPPATAPAKTVALSAITPTAYPSCRA